MTNIGLPDAMGELRPALSGIVSPNNNHSPDLSVLLLNRTGIQITITNQEERVIERPPTAGSVVSIFDGTTIYERAVSGFARSDVEKAAGDLIRNVNSSKGGHDEKPERHGDFVTSMKIDPLTVSTQEKLEKCRELHYRLQGHDPRIVNANVIYIERNEYAVFADSHADLAQRVQRVIVYAALYAMDTNGVTRVNMKIKSATGGLEVFEFSDDEIQALVKNTLALLKAERIEPGEYQVISAPGVSGTICHESFGHGVETDMFLKERAKAAHFIDKVVGSPLVNIYDDPSYHGAAGSYFFDDEGQLSSPTQIVENGVFRRGITDFYSANALGLVRSANGRKQDYSRKTYARMSNTFFAPGESKVEDMIAQVEHGVYLDDWNSGMEDPQGWGIQVTCRYGHEIKNGKITDRVFAPIGISGYVPDVLGSITAVSDSFSLEAGMCGKGHKELVINSAGGPHLLFKARLG